MPARTGAYSAALDGRGSEKMGCDCREIKPLKVMPCLIFRATNERSSSLWQTSSQAAIIPSGGSVLGRQKGGHITSPDMPTSVFVEALCMCVFICLCVRVCVCICQLCMFVCGCLSLSSCMCVCYFDMSHRSEQHPGAI